MNVVVLSKIGIYHFVITEGNIADSQVKTVVVKVSVFKSAVEYIDIIIITVKALCYLRCYRINFNSCDLAVSESVWKSAYKVTCTA